MPSMVAGSAARMSTVWTLEPKLGLWARHAENPNMAGESALSCRMRHHLILQLGAIQRSQEHPTGHFFEQPASASQRWVLWSAQTP